MKVFDLQCSQGHPFEGWFDDEADFQRQSQRRLLQCPLCDDHAIVRLPSAPRLNLSNAEHGPVQATNQAELYAQYLRAVREMVARTEDVGDRFADEARKMHYGEIEHRDIRGRATREEVERLREDGVEFYTFAVPEALKGPLQ
jgi:hypothetical protein